MLKRAVFIVLLLVMTLGLFNASAEDVTAPAFALAEYVPADAIAYAGLRVDDATIETIDELIARVAGIAAELGADVPDDLTLRGLLQAQTGPMLNIDATLAWLGESVGLGIWQSTTNNPTPSMIAIALDDRAAAEDFLTAALRLDPIAPLGRFTVYERGFQRALFSDDLLIILSDVSDEETAEIASGDYPRLSSDEAFVAGVGELPADDYIASLYVDNRGPSDAVMFGSPMAGYDSITAGLAILDGDTLTFDAVVTGPAASPGSIIIDPAFARFIPVDTTAFIHSAGLGSNIQTALDAASMFESLGPGEESQIAQGLAMVGIDLDELLTWTNGDYALFGRLDVPALLNLAMTPQPDYAAVSSAFDFGFVIATSDPAATEDFADSLNALIRLGAARAPEVTLSEEDIAGETATVITVEAPAGDGSVPFRFALAATDDVFVIGTYNAVAASLRQSPGFDNSPLTADAGRYWLNDATLIATIDGPTLIQLGAVWTLVVAGPAIGQVFDEIVMTLDSTAPAVTPTPRPTPTPPPLLGPGLETPEDVAELMAQLGRVLRHATVSTRQIDGGALARITVTIGQ